VKSCSTLPMGRRNCRTARCQIYLRWWNFGPGDARGAFAALRKFRPNQPLMAGEYWNGWFDAWGKPHNKTDGAKQTREIAWILDQGYSISLYMFTAGLRLAS